MCSHQGEMTTCAFDRACNWAARQNSSNKPASKSSGGPCSPNPTGAPTPMKSFGRNPASRTLQPPTPPPSEWPMNTSTAPSARYAYRALGAVDVFIGHSLGGGVGGWSVREAGFRPKLFIGVGAPVGLGEHGPPELLLAGLFEEFWRAAQLHARSNAQVVISPWCEHITEAYDPVLVRAAVKAACAAVGKPVPAAPTAWRCRF